MSISASIKGNAPPPGKKHKAKERTCSKLGGGALGLLLLLLLAAIWSKMSISLIA
jgi:hypothetical protein